MKERIIDLKKNWNSYILENKYNKGMNNFVIEAWDRSINYGLSYNNCFGKIVSESVIEIKVKKNRKLIEIAQPIMENIIETIKETSFSLILTDSEGVIIHIVECANIHEKHCLLNFVLGAQWDEKNVGSNAIGTALARNKDTHMVGAEHYAIAHHNWTCAAALIHNTNGEVIGCLDISGNVKDDHIHTFGIVTSATKIIEKQLVLMESYELIDNAFNSVLDGLISIDRSFNVLRMNEKMIELLEIEDEAINNLDIKKIFSDIAIELIVIKKRKNIRRNDYTLKYNNKNIDCLINISPNIINGEVLGAVIFVKEAVQVRRVVSQIAGFEAIYTFKDLLTNNDVFKETISYAKRIAKTVNFLMNSHSINYNGSETVENSAKSIIFYCVQSSFMIQFE